MVVTSRMFQVIVVLLTLLKVGVIFAGPASPEQVAKWKAEAQQRIEKRKVAITQLTGADDWKDSESIMNKTSTIGYLESINRLENKYFDAVPQADKIMREVGADLHLLNVEHRGTDAELKKDAAFRYLMDQPKAPDPYPSGLNSRQLLALAWEAIHDKAVFTNPKDLEDRKWGLLEALANIQRAHNDCRVIIDGQAVVTDAVNWRHNEDVELEDPRQKNGERDRISCEYGRFKRLIEHLDQIHPDVKIISGTGGPQPIPKKLIIQAILEGHRTLTPQIEVAERHRIVESFHSGSPEVYKIYYERLKQSIRSNHPSIQDAALESNMKEMMPTLLEEPEWEHQVAQSCRNDRGQNLAPQTAPIQAVLNHLQQPAGQGFVPVNDAVLGADSRLSPSGLIWGDMQRIAGANSGRKLTDQRAAFEECLNLNPPEMRASVRADLEAGRRPTQGYFLPRKQDWEEIAHAGRASLPNLRGIFFWSASVYSDETAYIFWGSDGSFTTSGRDREREIRCVGLH